LGLVAIHTLALAVARFFHLDGVYGKNCCNNIAALNQSSRIRQHVCVVIKHLDLHQTSRNLKCSTKMAFKYVHMGAHQDRIKPWSQLSLKEQLNMLCNQLANSAVARYLSEQTKPSRPDQLLPLESATIVLDSVKLPTDVGSEVQFCLGKEEAGRFYTSPTAVTNRCNTGGWAGPPAGSIKWLGTQCYGQNQK
jgi:hypothetical protein